MSNKPEFYKPIEAIIITIIVYLVALVLGAFLVSLIPLVFGWDEARSSAWFGENVWAQFLYVLSVQLVTLKLLWEILRRKKANFVSVGLNTPKIKYIFYAVGGFGIYFVTFLVSVGLISLLVPGFDLEQKQELGFDTTLGGVRLLPVFISLVILPPLVEEIVTRGFLFTGLRTKLPFIFAAIITSLLFGAAHLGAAKDGLLWIAGLDTFILSMVMCKLRESTGSLWPSIGMHFIKNFIAFFVLFNIIRYF